MDGLIRAIEAIRSKLDGLRKRSLKETPTRTIVVDPLLEALGWDVRDPDEVQLEYPTVDGKSVDYALHINGKPILLVEAKPLDDPLNDVKGITQVVGYAANDGIVWCVLTNGLIWKVYRSVEKCPAPEKLMFEVSLDPRDADGVSVEQIGRQMWKFSRAEMAKGTLDEIGEKTFNDSKVRKALDGIMRDAPKPLLHLVRTAAHDAQFTPQQINRHFPFGFPLTTVVSNMHDFTRVRHFDKRIPVAPSPCTGPRAALKSPFGGPERRVFPSGADRLRCSPPSAEISAEHPII